MQSHFRCSCLYQLLKVRLPLGVRRLEGLGFHPAGNEARSGNSWEVCFAKRLNYFPKDKVVLLHLLFL